MAKKILLVAVLALLLSACQFQGVSVERNADGSMTANVTLSESDVNGIIQTALAQSADPLLRNPSVDLQNGQIVVTGTHDKRDGSGSVSGTMTMTITVNNGALSAQVTSLSVEGLDASDQRIADLNSRLSSVLGQRGLGSNSRATITGVSISDSAITFSLNIQPK